MAETDEPVLTVAVFDLKIITDYVQEKEKAQKNEYYFFYFQFLTFT
jgi:hypothetical protein